MEHLIICIRGYAELCSLFSHHVCCSVTSVWLSYGLTAETVFVKVFSKKSLGLFLVLLLYLRIIWHWGVLFTLLTHFLPPMLLLLRVFCRFLFFLYLPCGCYQQFSLGLSSLALCGFIPSNFMTSLNSTDVLIVLRAGIPRTGLSSPYQTLLWDFYSSLLGK